MRRKPAGVAAILLGSGAVAVTAALVLGYLGRLHTAFDSFSHFRLHLAALAIACGLLLLPLRAYLAGLASIAIGAGAAAATLYGLAGPPSLYPDPDREPFEPRYRLLHLNLRFDNEEHGKVLSMIGRVRPDLILLNEVSEPWQERLAHLRAMYPYGIVCPPPTYIGGVALLSRRPLIGEAECLERGSLAFARVDFSGEAVDVMAVHLGWPWPFERPQELASARGHFAALDDTAIVAGDFNAVFWSWRVRDLSTGARLQLVRGVGPTWLEGRLPDGLRRTVGLPIDHVLVKGRVIPRAISTLEDAGSDHLPILYEFSLAPSEPRQEVMQAGL